MDRHATPRSTPLVSVVIPTHNRAELLRRALDSVYAQEGLGRQFELEVIVVDDASTDHTAEVVRRYESVRYVRVGTNRGAAAARNAGIATSTGTHLAFLDDDDVWLPHRLRLHVPVLEHSAEVGVVYGQHVTKKGDVFYDPFPHETSSPPSGNVFLAFLMEDFISVDTLLIRRSALPTGLLYDESLPTMEHYDFCLRLAFHVQFRFIPVPVAIQYLDRPVTSYWRGQSYGTTVLRIVEKGLRMLPDTPEYAGVKRRVRLSVFTRTAKLLEAVGDLERLHKDLLFLLREFPWIVMEREVRRILRRRAAALALTPPGAAGSPAAAVRTFCSEISAAVGARGLGGWLSMRRLWASLWAEAGVALGKGSARDDTSAGRAAARAVLFNPLQLRHRTILRLLMNGIFSVSRWDPFFGSQQRP
jgi:glycosyltransferase involved in cell wall biosynthesis